MSNRQNRHVNLVFDQVEITQPDLRINGSVEFSDEWQEDVSILHVAGLSEARESEVVDSDTVVIEAGYEDRMALIREGPVEEVMSTESRGQRITSIFVGTGLRDASDTAFNRNYSGAVTSTKIIEDAIGETDLLSVGSITEQIRYEKRNYVSNASRVIDSVVSDMRARAYIVDLDVFVDDGTTITDTVELQRGEIRRSKLPRIDDSEVWQIDTPLNPTIRESVSVVFDGREYRVIEGEHNISRWTTEVQVVQV